MKHLILMLCCTIFGPSLADNAYHYSVNLNRVNNDKVSVVLIPPDLSENEVLFRFPSMVPGTYEVYDFGRFISNFKVSGKNGSKVEVSKLDVNTYKISPATNIEKITYEVDDTFDPCDLPGTKEKIIFEPGGTNIESGKNFCLNTHSLFGYFSSHLSNPFELEFQKPAGFYPSTGASNLITGEEKDLITIQGYHNLVDSPILYTRPDTSTVQVGNTRVLVSAYSPNRKVNARFIANTLRELLVVQGDYLGGNLPVDKYAFLFYFSDKPTLSGASGALEHSYSSFYVLPEFDSLDIQQQIRDVSAHEFFHIVTPLTIHSREIGEFDFNNPQMSEHLWLYEGVTEYAAHHAQALGNITDADVLINTMMEKYSNSLKEYNDTMSFTFMSKNVLQEKIHKQYGNVYEKGAVIGMCLDILLRDLSSGKYGTRDLMKDLAKKYGKDRSFEDKDLFNDIRQFTYPEVGEFLNRHVGGHEPLPIKDILERVGINFEKEQLSYEFSLGGADLNYNEKTGHLYVESIDNMNEFGKEMGFKVGDEWLKLNGKELKIEKVREIISEFYNSAKEGDKVLFDINRPKNKRGKYKSLQLSATARKVKVLRYNQISLNKDMTDHQREVLKSWVGI
ncbi:MAG TPA: peptidase M61 [Bacteroidia bacterium]|nr:peptidase M61 [Bacteroidia bacterium]